MLTKPRVRVGNHNVRVSMNETDVVHLLEFLWPAGVRYDKVLLHVTEATPYMIKAGKDLHILCAKKIPVTYVAHVRKSVG